MQGMEGQREWAKPSPWKWRPMACEGAELNPQPQTSRREESACAPGPRAVQAGGHAPSGGGVHGLWRLLSLGAWAAFPPS